MRAVPTLRLFIAWLLLLALPLQAFAAASMKPCVQAQQQHAAVFAEGHGAGPHADATHHGHEAHHAAPMSMTVDDHGSPSHDVAAADADDAAHSCAICAGLCHAMAATSEPPRLRLGPPAATAPRDAGPSLASVTTSLPDKPPRG